MRYMKKITILVSILLLGTLGYMLLVSAVEKNVQTNIQKRITELTNHGFDIEKIKKGSNEDGYILTFKNMQKITPFIQEFSSGLPANLINSLQDMKLALDIQNDHGLFNDVKMEIYPTRLPSKMRHSLKKEELTFLKEHLEKKSFLLHLSLNKSLSKFTGNIKDIHIKGMKKELILEGKSFSGEIKDHKIIDYKANIQKFISKSEGKTTLEFSDMYTHESVIDKEITNRHYITKIKSFVMHYEDKSISLNDLAIDLASDIGKNLFDTSINATLGSLDLDLKNKKRALKDITLKLKLKNLNRKLLDGLAQKEIISTKELMDLLAKNNPSITIEQFSAKQINEDNATTQGFNMEAKITTDKQIIHNDTDKKISSLLKVNGKLTLSKTLLELLSQNPSFDILFLIIPQKEENGLFIYDVNYDETLIINNERLL